MGKAAGRQGIDSRGGPGRAWAGLHFVVRPERSSDAGWPHRLPAAVASLAAHGLLLAALLQARADLPAAGNSPAASERVQLHFVSADSIVREQGASASAAPTPAPAPPMPVSTPALTSPPTPTAVASPRPHSPARPLLAVVAEQAASPPAGPMADAAATVAAQAEASAAPVASQGAAGRGRGAHGQGTAAQSSAPLQHSQGVADWSQAVMRQLARLRSYPDAARAQRIEGVVMVQATIAADGRVLATRLHHSCGNPDLDAEALATFQRARRLPAPPAHLPSPLQVELPVAFTLRS